MMLTSCPWAVNTWLKSSRRRPVGASSGQKNWLTNRICMVGDFGVSESYDPRGFTQGPHPIRGRHMCNEAPAGERPKSRLGAHP